ncbi:hypothetical protein BEP19_00150 [Ammoniphilus oxalaticus]|uniref:Uncharacterized protein n=1 Tax=Ammoniphilus oxalaticus TaxID=66863 RepID=A0A419SRG0_9BACL|nr:transglycosylase domain-containing protein [Ammoniphilus oxalaticus]RKD27024.1 hypothetical protein BEP19_00150 [Ammoniphilus oxalaticus]
MHTDQPNKAKRQPSPGQVLWNVAKWSLLFLAMILCFSVTTATGYIASLVKDDLIRSYDEMSRDILTNHLTGFAYFRDQEAIGQLRAEQDRRLVKREEVSKYLIDAIIATEDKYFYKHPGIDPIGTSRATLEGLRGSSIQTGGSSLTQQLIKQTILSPTVSHERKAKEILLALRLERMFSKEEILEAYMNEMYFGRSVNNTNIYGVQAAARGIFGVDAKQLNIPQAAYIAGMLQAPSRYIPFEEKGLKAGLKRQKIVLKRMHENGYITAKEMKNALDYDIQVNLAKNAPKAYARYPFLMMEIEERAARVLVDQELEKDPNRTKADLSRQQYRELVDDKRQEVLRGGYHIYTTIDRDIYEMMNRISKNPANFGPNRNYKVNYGSEPKQIKDALEEVGATLIENKSGAILGFIGGRDFSVQQVNHTTRPRQPGSAMKPIAAYAPAFELGLLQPGSAIDDAPLPLDNGTNKAPHYPANWNNKFQGLITAREAFKWSYNIPAIKTYLKVGIPKALEFVEQMGVTTIISPEDNPKTNDFQAKTGVLGGLTQGLTVEEITNAYSVFANQGVFQDAYLIDKIVDANGETIFKHRPNSKPIFSKQTAYLMTDMMRTVVQEGTGAAIQRSVKGKRDIAGKTGTTNDNHDSWFVGYTPELTLGVWIGYDIPYRLPQASSARSTKIWSQVMNGLFELDPQSYPVDSTFKQPSGIKRLSICSNTGMLASPLCRKTGKVVTEIFNEKYAPTKIDDKHRTARVVIHDGKTYLAKDETPDDMVQEKVGVQSPEPIQFPKNPERYRMSFQPLDWEDRLPQKQDPRVDDGKPPTPPQNVVIQPQGKLEWRANTEADVVGYRIYHSQMGEPFAKVGVTQQAKQSAFSVKKDGLYYVTAVDVAGNESEASETIANDQTIDDNDQRAPLDSTELTRPKKDQKKKLEKKPANEEVKEIPDLLLPDFE